MTRARVSVPTVIVSAMCALLISGASAIAIDAYVTSKLIVNGTIKSVDVKDGALTGLDVKASSIAASKLNAAARSSFIDTSPWEKIPSGRTVTGAFFELDTMVDDNKAAFTYMQLPARPSVALVNEKIGFASDSSA